MKLAITGECGAVNHNLREVIDSLSQHCAYVGINRLQGEIPDAPKVFAEKMDAHLLDTIPSNDALAEFEFSGKPLMEPGDDSPVYQSVEKTMQ